MGTHLKAGFTIIETILVLGVTGALVVGIFVGVGTQLNLQRYRDSVESLKTLFQEQYSELSSIRNGRDNNWSCNSLGQTTPSGSEVRGQSECVMLGRLVTIQNTDIKVYTVIGNDVATPTLGLSDVASLQTNYVLNVSTVTVEEDTLEWGSLIARPTAGPLAAGAATPRDLSILFIRSPDSGQMYTFSSNTVATSPNPTTLRNLVVGGTATAGVGQSEQVICVNANNPLLNDDMGVYMSQYAVGPSAFETRSNDYWRTQVTGPGSATRC